MISEGQLLERFRSLSREIQNGIQTSKRSVDILQKKNPNHIDDLTRLSQTIADMDEAWQIFVGWLLISTLDDLEEARTNSTPGRINIQSKLMRSKIRRKNDSNKNSVKINIIETQEITFETHIAYFEQMLDLLVDNAIKYSVKCGEIEISYYREKEKICICIESIGPLVHKNESPFLGEKEFRSENAKKLNVSGKGFGLYNVKRLAVILGAEVSFIIGKTIICTNNGIPFSNFTAKIHFPECPPQNVLISS